MRLTTRALNRALLARQGLLEPFDRGPVDVVEAIGALQAQYWPALPVALWSRMRSFAAEDLYGALERRELVLSTLIRRTIHLVSAQEHPVYAAVADASGVNDWTRTGGEPSPETEDLRAGILAFAATEPRTWEEIVAFIEDWVAGHPGAIEVEELEFQRSRKWRPFSRWTALARVPADGRWGAKTPAAFTAVPSEGVGSAATPSDQAPASLSERLAGLIRCHLRAFGPAAADDVATWIGFKTPPVREALDGLGLERFEDESGRVLYDLPGAPKPDPETAAPVRFLPSFDSTLLAYASRRRERIVPEAHREAVYERANLRVLPTFLVDGFVAGLWSIEAKRREATVTVQPLERLDAAARAAVVEEAERLARFSQPQATAHRVAIA